MQFDRTIGKVRVVNAGSVGMPFGRPGADWLLLDTEISFNHTDYEIYKTAARKRESDYPLVEDFVVNNVSQAPFEEKMLEMLTQMAMT